MEVYVLQGERPAPMDNILLYKYVIQGVTVPPSGAANIAVKYQYDANGAVKVTAKQVDNGKNLNVKIESMPSDMSWTMLSPKEHAPSMPNIDIVLAIDLSGSMSGSPLGRVATI